METIKLFQQNVYQKECTAKILDMKEEKGDLLLVLDQTIFFPTGGGQSCDVGTINQTRVTDVFEKDGVLYHKLTQKNTREKQENFKPGDMVFCTIDWPHRFDNMQRHCGEHILSGMFHREYGGVNRGFHMGEDYMTVDISLEENPAFKEITWDMAMHVQDCTNEAIWQNLPVTVRRFSTREEAKNLPLRKALAIDEEISIVCVGSEENPSDCVACCGTHPNTSGQVGLLKILKVESNKGMFRIYFEAGKRAMEDYNAKHDLITALGNKYSAGAGDLLSKINAQDDKITEIKNELYVLRKSVINRRIEAISAEMETAADDKVFMYEYDDMKTDDLFNIGKPLTDKIKKLLLLVSAQDNTLLLFSGGSVDCSKLVKEKAKLYDGKGGGNAASARVIFPNRNSLDTFIDSVCLKD